MPPRPITTNKEKKTTLYFLCQEYADDSAAHNRYDFVFKANAHNEGIDPLQDVGDEAYFHSDGTNFLFIMVHKGKKVITMKVNKLTSNTSRQAFHMVAGSIAAKM